MISTKYLYTFRASNGVSVTVLRGDGAPKLSVESGWQIEARARRVGVTVWKGRPPYRMDVPILFDGWLDGRSVENDVEALDQMADANDLSQPPTVEIDGALPYRATWVIDTIDKGDDVYWVQRGGVGVRLRQDAIVHLIEWSPEQRVKILNTRTIPNLYVAKGGETLRQVAKQMYGDASKWQVIKKANPGVRDPNAIKKDQRLRIP